MVFALQVYCTQGLPFQYFQRVFFNQWIYTMNPAFRASFPVPAPQQRWTRSWIQWSKIISAIQFIQQTEKIADLEQDNMKKVIISWSYWSLITNLAGFIFLSF